MSEKRTSTESSHDDQQTTKDSGGELTQDPSELPNHDDDEMSEKQTSTESSHDDQQTTKESGGELMQDPSELPYDNGCGGGGGDDMSKKRTSTESSHDEQTTKESSGELIQAVFQNEEDNTKRAILASLSDTTLDDLPMELIVHILVKAVAMEVKSMRLAKSVWKEKADPVISRLRTVSLQWSSILSTDFFRNELHRTLDGIAQETLRWEVVLHQPPIQSYIYNLTTMRDEVFLLFVQHRGYVLNVYDRNNVAKPKDVIPIPEKYPMGHNMAACILTNCVYLLNEDRLNGLSVIRVWKDEHQYKVSTWIQHLILPKPSIYSGSTGLSVSALGSLIIISNQDSPTPTEVGIYDANGIAQHKITLCPDTHGFIHVSHVIEKADGNLVVSFCNNTSEAKLLEIDTSGRIIRKYKSSHIGAGVRCYEDIYGRILVNYAGCRIELLDSEFNLLDTAVPHTDDGHELNLYHLQYNSHRHEMVGVRWDCDTKTSVVVTLRFT